MLRVAVGEIAGGSTGLRQFAAAVGSSVRPAQYGTVPQTTPKNGPPEVTKVTEPESKSDSQVAGAAAANADSHCPLTLLEKSIRFAAGESALREYFRNNLIALGVDENGQVNPCTRYDRWVHLNPAQRRAVESGYNGFSPRVVQDPRENRFGLGLQESLRRFLTTLSIQTY